MEASNSGGYRDVNNIHVLKHSIVATAKEIVQRTFVFRVENIICTECFKKLPLFDLNKESIHILCHSCLKVK